MKIQQLACRGRTVDETVEELAEFRIPRDQVMRVLNEDPGPRQRYRPERAGVGYAWFKKGRPGYGR